MTKILFSKKDCEFLRDFAISCSLKYNDSPFFKFRHEIYRRLSLLGEFHSGAQEEIYSAVKPLLYSKIDSKLVDCLDIDFMWNSPFGLHQDESVRQVTVLLVLANGFNCKVAAQIKKVEKKARQHLDIKFNSKPWLDVESPVDWEDFEKVLSDNFQEDLKFKDMALNLKTKKGVGSQVLIAEKITKKRLTQLAQNEFEPSHEVKVLRKFEAEIGSLMPFILLGNHGAYQQELPEEKVKENCRSILTLFKENGSSFSTPHVKLLDQLTPSSLCPSLLTMTLTLRQHKMSKETVNLFYDYFVKES